MLNKLPQTADAQQQTHIISVFVDQESVCCSLECLCFSVPHKTAIMSALDAIIPRLNLERAHFQAQSYGCWCRPQMLILWASPWHSSQAGIWFPLKESERGSPRWKPPSFCNLKMASHLFFRHVLFVERNSTMPKGMKLQDALTIKRWELTQGHFRSSQSHVHF